MSNFCTFHDAATGFAHITDKGKKLFVDSKDNKKSIIAQIDMTHSGIITANRGFYLPNKMKRGAASFTQNYNKPVLISHNADSDPVGRVISADYVDFTKTNKHNDKKLESILNILDKKQDRKPEIDQVLELYKYVVGEYWGTDRAYKGLGTIRGTMKISDPEAIEKILDERYLTVSTSMSTNAAFCSVCGQDWISEGQCEHERGTVYGGLPMSLIPGDMSYNHVGIVSEPADPYAAKFTIVKDGVKKDYGSDALEKNSTDVVANLFWADEHKLFSFGAGDVDLIEVKDNIARLEDLLTDTERKMDKTILDMISATISLWKSGEDETVAVEVRKYAENISEENLKELSLKAMEVIKAGEKKDSISEDCIRETLVKLISDETIVSKEIPKTESESTEEAVVESGEQAGVTEEQLIEQEITQLDSIENHGLKKKELKELASVLVKKDALSLACFDLQDKTKEEIVEQFKVIKAKQFKLADTATDEVNAKMKEFLGEDANLDSTNEKTCAGTKGLFPILSKAHATAAKKVLSVSVATDSLKKRILAKIEKLETEVVEETPVEKTQEVEPSTEAVTAVDSISDEELISQLKALITTATERDLTIPYTSDDVKDKEMEIEILEKQLDAANVEIEELTAQLTEMKDEIKKNLAEKVVNAKIEAGALDEASKDAEVESHLSRTEDSLRDSLDDWSTSDSVVKKKIADLAQIQNPTINATLSDNQNSVEEDINDSQIGVETQLEKRERKRKALQTANRSRF